MSDLYLTVANHHTFEQEIKKSRFICSIAKVHSENESKEFIQSIQNKYSKANHHCYAYTIGEHAEIKRESDNGEPSGTAGLPILNTLEKEQLHDVVAVVTRYFGGIKLGAGGLIRAYGGTTSLTINEIGLAQRITQQQLIIQVTYSNHEKLKYYLSQNDLVITNEVFGTDVTVTVPVDVNSFELVTNQLTNQFNDSLTISLGSLQYNEIPYSK